MWSIKVTDRMKSFARQTAQKQELKHNRNPNSTPFSEKSNYVGCLGEEAWGALMGVFVNRTFKAKTGFVMGEYIVDVSTARKPYYLFREKGKSFIPDLYVLAQFSEKEIVFIGWASREELQQAPIKKFIKENHYIPSHQLHDMEEFPIKKGQQ